MSQEKTADGDCEQTLKGMTEHRPAAYLSIKHSFNSDRRNPKGILGSKSSRKIRQPTLSCQPEVVPETSPCLAMIVLDTNCPANIAEWGSA